MSEETDWSLQKKKNKHQWQTSLLCVCKKGLGKVKNRNTLLWIVILLTVYKNVLLSKELQPPCWLEQWRSLWHLASVCVPLWEPLAQGWRSLEVTPPFTPWPLPSVWRGRSSVTVHEKESVVLPSGRLPQWVVVDPTVSLQVWGSKLDN